MAVGLLLIMTLSKLPVGVPEPVMLTPIEVLRLTIESHADKRVVADEQTSR